jgi:hypothetical protein
MRGNGHTRRRVFAATAGATLITTAPAGCGLFDDDSRPRAADPLQPVLEEAVALAAAYDRAAAAQPALSTRLTPLGADHRAHAAELATMIGAEPSSVVAVPSAPPGEPGAALAGLRKAEQQAQRSAAAACRAASAERAALVGSIAACRAAHVEALR